MEREWIILLLRGILESEFVEVSCRSEEREGYGGQHESKADTAEFRELVGV